MSFSDSFAKGFNVGFGTVNAVSEGKRRADERIAQENADKKAMELFHRYNGNISKIDMDRDINDFTELQALSRLTQSLSNTEQGRESMKKLTDARAVEGAQKIKAGLSLVDERMRAGDMDGAIRGLEYVGTSTPTSTTIQRTGHGRAAIMRPNIATGEYETLFEGSVPEIRAKIGQLLMDEPKLREGFIREQMAEQDTNLKIMNDPSQWLYDDEGNPYVQQYNVLNGGLRFLDPRTNRYVDKADKKLLPWNQHMEAKREARTEEQAQYERGLRPRQERAMDLKLQAAEQDLATGGYSPTNDARQLQEYTQIVSQAQNPDDILMAAKQFGVLQKIENDMGGVSGYFAPIPGGRVIYDENGSFVRAEGSNQQGMQTSGGAGVRPAPQGVKDGQKFRDKQSGKVYFVRDGKAYPMD